MAIPTAFVVFREVVQRHVKDLERATPERYSTTWFFLRYLRRVHKFAHGHDTPRAAGSAMRGLVRFYVDSITQDSDLAWRFEEVLDAHRGALRDDRPG
jgi:hypothetical protein